MARRFRLTAAPGSAGGLVTGRTASPSARPQPGAIATAALAAFFPLFFWWGQSHPGAHGLMLVPVAASLARAARHWRNPAFALLLVGVLALLAAAVALDVSTPLKAYPALVSASLLVAFATSLVYPPSIAEQIARLSEPHLSAAGVRYTRRVTEIWCLFFAANLGVSLVTAFAASERVWLWYNGCISYALVALLYGAEWWVRQRVKARHVQPG